jgi:hypothetical protein
VTRVVVLAGRPVVVAGGGALAPDDIALDDVEVPAP